MIRKNYLKERRLATGRSQKKLAEETGLSLATINRYENGSRGIDREKIELLANVLGVKPHELFTRPDTKEEVCAPTAY